MAAGVWQFPTTVRTYMLDGRLDFDTHTFKIALFNSSWVTTTTLYNTTNELATANGYTQAGQSFGALTLAGTTTVTVDDPADIVWTASGGSITARYAVIYDDSDATTPKAIICYCLLDSTPADVTVTTGNTLTISLSVSGIFTLA